MGPGGGGAAAGSAALADAWARWRWWFRAAGSAGGSRGRQRPPLARSGQLVALWWHWRALAGGAARGVSVGGATGRRGLLAPFWLHWRGLARAGGGAGARSGGERDAGCSRAAGDGAEFRELRRVQERDLLDRAWRRWQLPTQHRRDQRGGGGGSYAHNFGDIGLLLLKRSPAHFCFETWRENAEMVSLDREGRFLHPPTKGNLQAPNYAPPPPFPPRAVPRWKHRGLTSRRAPFFPPTQPPHLPEFSCCR